MTGKINVAIDGYSSCGKSTLARDLANELRYTYIDSGAMYRAVTLFCLRKGIEINDKDKVISCLDYIKIHFESKDKTNRVILNGEDVEDKIREMEVSNMVSQVSAISEVREKMVKLQRKHGENGGVVMDGRDIGTVVFPDAELKIFMEADPDIRAKRRLAELEQKGKSATLEQVLRNLQDRDFMDTTRQVSPLKKAKDAVVLNNSKLTVDQQLYWALNLAKVRLSG